MTQKHIFLIVVAGLWGFLHKAMTSLQSDPSARPISSQRRARLSMIPSGMGALPWAGNTKCHLHVCLQVMFYEPNIRKSLCARKHPAHKHRSTHGPTHTKVKHLQTALFALPIPLKVHQRPNESRDGLCMFFQSFSFLDNLITSDRGDAARSPLVQGHSLLGPQLRKCVKRRGGER